MKRADLILVMERGRIVESGTHRGLVNQAGPYARLVAAQLASKDEGDALSIPPLSAL